MEAGCTRAEGGLFGCTTAFFAATEAQNSTGSLHTHMLIWIKDMPAAIDDYYAIRASSRFRDALGNYVDAIATASVPLDLSTCPSCDSKAIEPVELERHAFRKSRPGALRPTTTACKDCGANFGESCKDNTWTSENRIEMKRQPGNEHINAYVPVINALFKCNHDIKFLSAREGEPEKAYYTMKYSAKDQNDIEKPWAVHLNAFDKANSGLSGENNDATIGRRRSQSMCCTLPNPQKGFRSNGMSLPHQGLGVLSL
ncbi:hypothetical protein DVH05_006518 [Phytophthora capsici]|nr:hypothetical protein DVH05_006518 [Phytophthora capsici]